VVVLGILSVVLCAVLGPVAWWRGTVALGQIDQNPAAYNNRASVQVGRGLGIAASCLMMLAIGAFVLSACGSLVGGL
jgi:hypothetical protein